MQVRAEECRYVHEGEPCYYFSDMFREDEFYYDVYRGRVPFVRPVATVGVRGVLDDITISMLVQMVTSDRVRSSSYDLWVFYVNGYEIWGKVDAYDDSSVILTLLLPEEY